MTRPKLVGRPLVAGLEESAESDIEEEEEVDDDDDDDMETAAKGTVNWRRSVLDRDWSRDDILDLSNMLGGTVSLLLEARLWVREEVAGGSQFDVPFR